MLPLKNIESRSLVPDLCSALEYGGIPEFLSRLKTRGHALMAKWGQEILLETDRKQKDLSLLSSWMQGSGNDHWDCARNGSRKRGKQVMRFYGTWDHLVHMRRNLTSHRPCGKSINRNAAGAGDPDSPRSQIQRSVRIQAEVSRVRLLHCCSHRYWLSSRYGQWPSAKWWTQRRKSAYYDSHLSAQMCVSLQSICCELG